MQTYDLGALLSEVKIHEQADTEAAIEDIQTTKDAMEPATRAMKGSKGSSFMKLVGTILGLSQGSAFGAFFDMMSEMVGLMWDTLFVIFLPAMRPIIEMMKSMSRFLVSLADTPGGIFNALLSDKNLRVWASYIIQGFLGASDIVFDIGANLFEAFSDVLEGDVGDDISEKISNAWDAAIKRVEIEWSEFSPTWREMKKTFNQTFTKKEKQKKIKDATSGFQENFVNAFKSVSQIFDAFNRNMPTIETVANVVEATMEAMREAEELWEWLGRLIARVLWDLLHKPALIGGLIGGYLGNLLGRIISPFNFFGLGPIAGIGFGLGFLAGYGAAHAILNDGQTPSRDASMSTTATRLISNKSREAKQINESIPDPDQKPKPATVRGGEERRVRQVTRTFSEALADIEKASNSTGNTPVGGAG